MGYWQRKKNNLLVLPILLGVVMATGSYRGHQAESSSPVLGGALIVGGIALYAGLWYYNKD